MKASIKWIEFCLGSLLEFWWFGLFGQYIPVLFVQRKCMYIYFFLGQILYSGRVWLVDLIIIRVQIRYVGVYVNYICSCDVPTLMQ